MIGRMPAVRADLAAVTVTCDGCSVAVHERCSATAQTITDPERVVTARRLRDVLTSPPPTSCMTWPRF